MLPPFQKLISASIPCHASSFTALLVLCALASTTMIKGQSLQAGGAAAKRPWAVKKAVPGNGRIELLATAPGRGRETKPLSGREFILLVVDPESVQAQIEKEIPLPETPSLDSSGASRLPEQESSDIAQVAKEFNVSPGFVRLAQKAPQDGKRYRDEPKYRRWEDYAGVDELKKSYALLLKKKAKKGNVAVLSEDQKMDLAQALDAEFNRLPPPDKTSIPVRLAQLMIERENRAFTTKRQRIEQTNATLERRTQRRAELFNQTEKTKKLFRVTSDPRGVAKFSKLLPGTYWAYADNFEFEGVKSSWNIPIALRRNEVKRIELVMGNH